jgi:hypothetical protein
MAEHVDARGGQSDLFGRFAQRGRRVIRVARIQAAAGES